jgi:hypothetical protein
MADIPALTQFSLSENEDGYLLQLEADDGAALTVSASPEQLDAIIDALVALLEDEDEDDDAPQAADPAL